MIRPSALDRLRHSVPAVLPSLLLCDFGNLEREVRALEESGVPGLHLDVMDGSFVPNLSYGMPIVAAIRGLTELPIDVHLMIQQPQNYVKQFREAGADSLTIHIEAVEDPRPVLEQIRSLGCGAGIALNPPTPISRLEGCLDLCDLVLVMSVQAGFGGQSFNPVALDKLRQVRTMVEPDVLLEIDGGINSATIAQASSAGAQLFVVGSAIFGKPDYQQAVTELTHLATPQPV